jgi:hypothetical protein
MMKGMLGMERGTGKVDIIDQYGNGGGKTTSIHVSPSP